MTVAASRPIFSSSSSSLAPVPAPALVDEPAAAPKLNGLDTGGRGDATLVGIAPNENPLVDKGFALASVPVAGAANDGFAPNENAGIVFSSVEELEVDPNEKPVNREAGAGLADSASLASDFGSAFLVAPNENGAGELAVSFAGAAGDEPFVAVPANENGAGAGCLACWANGTGLVAACLSAITLAYFK